MKAIRAHAFGGPENLMIEEVATPTPGPGQVLIDVKAAGINPADTYMLTGNYAITPQLPYTPGGDCAGLIHALGEGVEGLERVADLGAVLAVDHTKPDYLEDVRAVTRGAGPDLILEMLADKNLAVDMELAAKFGRIVIIGCRGEVAVAPRLAMMKELDILGTAIWNIDRALVEEALADIIAGLADGSVSPLVGQTFALADAAAAHHAVLAPGTRGKIVLT